MSKYTEYMFDKSSTAGWLKAQCSMLSNIQFNLLETAAHDASIKKQTANDIFHIYDALIDLNKRLYSISDQIHKEVIEAMDKHDERADKKHASQKDKREKLKDMYDCFSDILPDCLNKTVMNKG